MLVLDAIDAFHSADAGSRDVPLDFDARRSVEGAVMGGRLASHAVSGLPLLSDIAGYAVPGQAG